MHARARWRSIISAKTAPRAKRCSSARTSGGVTINDVIFHFSMDDLPFGGVGPSGMGAYHGERGFRSSATRRRCIARSRAKSSRMLRPPYGAAFRKQVAARLKP